jgi:hypothetical protein
VLLWRGLYLHVRKSRDPPFRLTRPGGTSPSLALYFVLSLSFSLFLPLTPWERHSRWLASASERFAGAGIPEFLMGFGPGPRDRTLCSVFVSFSGRCRGGSASPAGAKVLVRFGPAMEPHPTGTASKLGPRKGPTWSGSTTQIHRAERGFPWGSGARWSYFSV